VGARVRKLGCQSLHQLAANELGATCSAGEAADLGVMAVNCRDAVKFNYGFQGALQGAGTPNQAGLGAFIPLHAGSNSVAFVDVLVNANFNDYVQLQQQHQ
jgi:hypothetical protein